MDTSFFNTYCVMLTYVITMLIRVLAIEIG